MKKQERKIIKLNEEANACTSREEAQKIINKHNKARAKLLAKKLISDV